MSEAPERTLSEELASFIPVFQHMKFTEWADRAAALEQERDEWREAQIETVKGIGGAIAALTSRQHPLDGRTEALSILGALVRLAAEQGEPK